MFRLMWVFLILVTLLFPSITAANVGEDFGFGSRTAALAGAGAAWGFDGYSAYSNPAGLGLTNEKKVTFSYGLILMDPQFLPINNVVLENNYTSDKTTPRLGNVENDYSATFGQAIGASFKALPNRWNLSAGITIFSPINQFAYMDTGETFLPEYILYRARTQRPQFEIGLGLEPLSHFYLGAGLHVAYSLTSNASVFLQTSPSKPSTMRFSGSLKPKVAPYFGFLLAHPQASAGLVARLPIASANTMTLNSGANVLGPLAALDFRFNSFSALFYDPLSLELAGSIQHASFARFYAQLDYQFWSKFESPALSIQNPQADSGVTISSGKNPSYEYRNILTPRLAEEFTFGDTIFRVGYAYHQSILKNLPTDSGNYLDPSKHMLSAGVGLRFKSFLGFDTPSNLDFHIAYHKLVTQHVSKTPGDEIGTGTGDLKIGAPGYDAGGKILGGGVSLTLAL